MLSGDNGILEKAKQSKEKTGKEEIIESARLDVLAQIAENKGEKISEEQFVTILNKYFNDVPNTIPEDLSEMNLTSINGEYAINGKEIYEGTLKTENLTAGL